MAQMIPLEDYVAQVLGALSPWKAAAWRWDRRTAGCWPRT